MSSYYTDDRPRRRRSHRDRDRDRDREYVEEERYVARGAVDPRDSRKIDRMDLVTRRRDDSTSSVEEIQREFAPGDGGYIRKRTTVREGVRPARRARSNDRYDRGYYDDRRSDYSRRSRRYEDDRRSRRSRRDDYSDSPSSRSRSRSRGGLEGAVEKTLAALGIGGAAAAATKGRDHSRSRAGHRSSSRGRRARSDYSSSRSRSRSRGDKNAKLVQAVKAALAAGAAEAVRTRKEPGGFNGDKGKRIITAAIGAAGIDGILDRDPDKHGKRHIIESALAGLATNRIVNGPRSRSRGPDRDRRARSQSRGGGVKDLAAGAGIAAVGKSLFDRVRSRSRGRAARSPSVSSFSSYDSRSPPPRREKKRSKSISDMARKGMAALGVGGAAAAADKDKRRSRGADYSSDEDYPRDVGQPRSMPAASGASHVTSPKFETEAHHLGDPNTDSDSDLGASTDEDQGYKKSRNRQMLTAGLATVATIHAAHNLHQSMQARDERHKAVKEGEMSRSEARKEKSKARLQDAASIGIAALGIKGAMSEWKEVKEQRDHMKEEKEKIERHKAKRAARRAKMLEAQKNGTHPGPYGAESFSSSAPNLQSPEFPHAQHPNPYIPAEYQYASTNPAGGPVYHDGNPYGSDPAVHQQPMPSHQQYPRQ